MTMKRKFDMALEADSSPAAKQVKLTSWSEVMDIDVDMSDASPNSSPGSDCATLPSALAEYPAFQLYPSTDTISDYSRQPHIGLMQPTGFTHNNGSCSMIPKLRISCESGLSGRRTMWSFCEECGAIALVQ